MKYLVIKCGGWLVLLCLGTGMLFADDGGQQPIEIFSGGKKYASMEVYRQEEKMNSQPVEKKDEAGEATSAEDNFSETRQMFDDALRTAKNPLSLKFNPTKMKTIYIQKPVAASSLAKAPAAFRASKSSIFTKDPLTQSYILLNQMGFDQGVHNVVSEFTLGKQWRGTAIDSSDLERVLRDSFGDSTQPVLLISDRGKLRLMELDEKQSQTGDQAPSGQ
jgi:hypothetical protein